MAKALIGYLNSDPRAPHHLTLENAKLRARVEELSQLVHALMVENDRLKAENDRLVASHAELLDSTLEEMQPA